MDVMSVTLMASFRSLVVMPHPHPTEGFLDALAFALLLGCEDEGWGSHTIPPLP